MLFAILLAATGLTLSAVAIYYSVIGLTAVFAAAFWPVVVMGATLEIAKLVAASWLKMYWEKIPRGMKIYMTTAVVVLMFITSMGIFGFLSKAHLDQNLVSGDVVDRVAIIDEKIRTERDNIEASRKALKQMDEAVDQTMSRSDNERGAERAVQIRRQQQAERNRLQTEIGKAQSNIAKLNEERAPIAKDLRKVEAEVGPIKYIAKLIYGDNPDTNILEKAVTWVIMIIVFVFDPLAVLLLLGAQMTWQWRKDNEQTDYPTIADLDRDVGEPPTEEELSEIDQDTVEEVAVETQDRPWPFPSTYWPFPKKEDDGVVPHKTNLETVNDIDLNLNEPSTIDEWNKMIEEAEKEVEREKEKSAKQLWKEEHPTETIKHHEKLKELGIISTLPWEIAKEAADPKYQIFPELQSTTTQDRVKPDFTEVIEPDGSKKKNYIVKEQTQQIKKTRN